MTDSTLQRIWNSRESISRQFEFDSHKLVQFYQKRQKEKDNRTKESKESVYQIKPSLHLST